MSSLVSSVFSFHNYFTDNKSKSSDKMWSSMHAQQSSKTPSSAPVFHCQAACARPSPAHTKTWVTWGRGCLRACASQADGDQPAPAELGLHRGGSRASGSAASRGSGWGPGPRGWPSGPQRATAPRAAGTAAPGRQVRRATGEGRAAAGA